MEQNLSKFSSRADLVCRMSSDPSQSMHFLSRIYDWQLSSPCFICKHDGSSHKYHLHCDTCNMYFHKDCYIQPTCRMSEVTKPHNLQKLYGFVSFCSSCQQPRDVRIQQSFYRCATCNVDFHKGCHLYPPEIKHPFHPYHPLKLTFSSSDHSYSNLPSLWLHEPSDSETEPETSSHDVSISDVKCKCCQKHLHEIYYHCSICNFSLNLTCTRKPPPLTITNLKSHEHPLTIFPRRVPSPCDACGLSLDNIHDHVYTCHPCDYMVHRTCIYLPRVIKITRHPHRLSFSSSLPSGVYNCGVCRRTINVTYGQFSCVKGCHYAVHSKCVVEGRVWDGIDLEGVPEEHEGDNEPFIRMDDETIQHFSHEHYLRLHENNNVCDENKFCQACILPILLSESFYSCMQCDFLLHEACASLPRKKDHPLHRHPLILHPISPDPMEYAGERHGHIYLFSIEGMFTCNGCDQKGYGFVYKCCKDDCYFKLDIRCASLPDPVNHGSHQHDLFFNLTQGECMGCKSSQCSSFSLECMECKSFLGLKCASLPSVTYYKHDKHPLNLCYGEEEYTTSGQYWCEICEAALDAKEWFYKCDDYCCVTVHISCLFGKETFMMKPMSFMRNDRWFSVLRNSDNTRATCCVCGRRSTEPFIFKEENEYYCSLLCFFK